MRFAANSRPLRLAHTAPGRVAAHPALARCTARMVWINRRINMLPIYALCLVLLGWQALQRARAC